MKVVFFSPHFPLEMPRFVRGLAEVGVQVHGLGDVPLESIPAETRQYLSGYIQILSLHAGDAAVRDALPDLRRLQPDQIECLWEPCVVVAAQLREALGLPGQGVQDAIAFRDKPIMKQRVAAAGLRVPHNARVHTANEAREAAEIIGFPLVLKPIAGAGSADTYRVDDAKELEATLQKLGHLPEASIEEYIDGQEYTYDTVSVDGEPLFDSIAWYRPRPLEARSNEWVSPAQIVLRDPHQPALEDAVAFGRSVLKAMGMGTGFTHMEWFRKPNGELVFGEIAARPPGARLVDQMNYANDFDVYREWARVACWRTFEAPIHRRYHVAAVFKRAQGQGRIREIHGMDHARRALGEWLVADELLPIGTPRRDWKQTLLSDGCLIVRHPDLRTCEAMMHLLVQDVHLIAG
jgi:hypothetical protein